MLVHNKITAILLRKIRTDLSQSLPARTALLKLSQINQLCDKASGLAKTGRVRSNNLPSIRLLHCSLVIPNNPANSSAGICFAIISLYISSETLAGNQEQ